MTEWRDTLPKPSDVEVTVHSIKGRCAYGHKVGDKIYFDGKTIKGDICYYALMVILPNIIALRHGADFPWAEAGSCGDLVNNACPDEKNPVVFQLERIRRE